MTTLLLALILQAEPMAGAELNRRIEAFAKNGGGDLHVVAITTEANRPKYTFSSEKFKAADAKLLKKK